MAETFPVLVISKTDLVAEVSKLSASGHRLVQICATMAAQFEITYTFDSNAKLTHLRVNLDKGDPRVPSITGSFPCAFTYENEIHDLFGIQVTGLTPDFKGTFYKTAIPTPFAVPKPETKPAGKSS